MTVTRLLTAEDLWEMADEIDGTRTELVRGVLVKTMPPGGDHGKATFDFGYYLKVYVLANPIGDFFTDTGFVLARDPDIVRAPDIAFVRADRLPPPDQRGGFLPLAPDLAIEIVSPGDRAGEIADKVSDYLDAGVRLVWVLYPRRRMVMVHHPDGTAHTLRGDAVLNGEDVLPGFRLALTELFR